LSTGIAAIVVQFGLAMIPLGMVVERVGVDLADDERDLGVHAPTRWSCRRRRAGLANAAPELLRGRPPAENSAMSMPEKVAVGGVLDLDVAARHGSVVPAERAEAKTGSRRREVALDEQRRITAPT
jgi:hypothetical protein